MYGPTSCNLNTNARIQRDRFAINPSAPLSWFIFVKSYWAKKTFWVIQEFCPKGRRYVCFFNIVSRQDNFTDKQPSAKLYLIHDRYYDPERFLIMLPSYDAKKRVGQREE